MEHILNRVALEHDLPVSSVRAAMESAIHEGFMNPNGHMREVFGDRELCSAKLYSVRATSFRQIAF